jgi:hypothetical protein
MYRSDNTWAKCIPYNVSFNKRTGKIYYLYSRIDHPNQDASGQILRLNCIKLRRPPEEIEKRYEDHSKNFKDYIMGLMEDQTKTHDPSIKHKKISDNDIVNELSGLTYDELGDFLTKNSTKNNIILDAIAIKFKYNISESKSRFLKKLAERNINSKSATAVSNEEAEKDDGAKSSNQIDDV